MFTGIVQHIGRLASSSEAGGDLRIGVATTPEWLAGTVDGDSIAVNGVCLTVSRLDAAAFMADASRETLGCTTIGQWKPGAPLNLEKALRAGDPLGGHLVSGHVDAVADVLECRRDGRSLRIRCSLPAHLAPLVAVKGSICIDGTSLTVNEVESDRFGVNIVPHTSEMTIVGGYAPGTRVNLEVDLVARYLARMIAFNEGRAG